MQIHGGEGKTKDIKLDFSVNINPLGMPKSVRDAFEVLAADPSALEVYPDRSCEGLRRAAAGHYRVPEDWIVCGCGASELIYKIAYLYRGCRALAVSPGFGEYEKALREAGCEVRVLELKRERGYAFDEDFLERFYQMAEGESCFRTEREEESGFCAERTEESGPRAEKLRDVCFHEKKELKKIDLVFLCSPNNPAGGRIPKEMLKSMLVYCAQRGIRAVVDECFLPFVTGEEPTVEFLRERAAENTESRQGEPIILKALTKSHAIPGVRLGLAISSDTKLVCALQNTGAPWTVSGIAAKLGEAAFAGWDEEEFDSLRRTVAEERSYLEHGLTEAGAKVYFGEGNFILFSVTGGETLFDYMRSHGILIRSCESFGLGEDFYRIAVRTRKENVRFLEIFEAYSYRTASHSVTSGQPVVSNPQRMQSQ